MTLLEPVTHKEVKETMISIKPTKSSGPNGYSNDLFGMLGI